MKRIILLVFPLLAGFFSHSQKITRWDLDSLDKTGGYTTTIYDKPTLIETPSGKAIKFDGVNDGIFVANNPMNNLTEFTIEVIFNPYSGGNFEQRFLHFQQDNDNRILMELRYINNTWYFDTFIKSGLSSRTLIDAANVHPMDKWYHLALVYKNGVMSHFVDGVLELTGSVTYATVNSGQTSIGMRQTFVNYFKGAIKTVKVSGVALKTTDFITREASELNTILGTEYNMETNASFAGSVFPCPASEEAHILITKTSKENLKTELSSILGEKVTTKIEMVSSGQNTELRIARGNLPAGIYLLHILKNDNRGLVRTVVFE